MIQPRFEGAMCVQQDGVLEHLDVVAGELVLLDEALLDLQGTPRVAKRKIDCHLALKLLLHVPNLLVRVERVVVLAAPGCNFGEIPIAEALPQLLQQIVRHAR